MGRGGGGGGGRSGVDKAICVSGLRRIGSKRVLFRFATFCHAIYIYIYMIAIHCINPVVTSKSCWITSLSLYVYNIYNIDNILITCKSIHVHPHTLSQSPRPWFVGWPDLGSPSRHRNAYQWCSIYHIYIQLYTYINGWASANFYLLGRYHKYV